MQQFDDLEYPDRKPWLLIILVIVVGVVAFRCYRERQVTPRQEPQKPKPEVVVRGKAAATATNAVKLANLPPPSAATNIARLVAAKKPPQNPVIVGQLLADAKAAEEQRELPKAREKYLKFLKEASDPASIAEVESRLGRINIELTTTPNPMPEKVDYIVKNGDSIEKIARKFNSTVDLVQKSNSMANSNLIKAGDHLRIFSGKFSITVSKTRNDLLLTMNDGFFKRYSVGTGKFGKTPLGKFILTEHIKEPVWWRPDGAEVPYGDKNNILGTRWMTLRATGTTPDARGYGIHGTWDDTSIGKAESAGCIRMRNPEVEELFILVPAGTPVTITE
jgi:lipoprotein-anchoring transpeptidase ErfK/SrfK